MAPAPGRASAGRQVSMASSPRAMRPSAIQMARPAAAAPLKSTPTIRRAVFKRSGVKLLLQQGQGHLNRGHAHRVPIAVELVALDDRLAPLARAAEIDEAEIGRAHG